VACKKGKTYLHEAEEHTTELNVTSDRRPDSRAGSTILLFRQCQLVLGGGGYWGSENICKTKVPWGLEIETGSQIHVSRSTVREHSAADKVKFVCQTFSGVSKTVICNYSLSGSFGFYPYFLQHYTSI
jgi:hypothetical protein